MVLVPGSGRRFPKVRIEMECAGICGGGIKLVRSVCLVSVLWKLERLRTAASFGACPRLLLDMAAAPDL